MPFFHQDIPTVVPVTAILQRSADKMSVIDGHPVNPVIADLLVRLERVKNIHQAVIYEG